MESECEEGEREPDEYGTLLLTGRCAECPLTKFENSMESVNGSLINRAFSLKAALESGFHMTLDEVKADEFGAMQVIRSETATYQVEQQERERAKQR